MNDHKNVKEKKSRQEAERRGHEAGMEVAEGAVLPPLPATALPLCSGCDSLSCGGPWWLECHS